NTIANGSSGELRTYTWPANKVANAILMKFDLTSVPSGSTIQSASLGLSLTEADATTDATYTATVHKVINKNPNLASATVSTYDGVNPWTASSCCSGGVPLAQADIAPASASLAVDKALGRKSISIVSLVQDEVNAPASN